MKINHSKQAGLAKNPNANDTSFGAFSMACERVELAKLNAQAIHHLSASIVRRKPGFEGPERWPLVGFPVPVLYDVQVHWQLSVDLFFGCGGDHVFSNPGDAPLDAEQEADWQQIEAGPLKWVRHCRRFLGV